MALQITQDRCCNLTAVNEAVQDKVVHQIAKVNFSNVLAVILLKVEK